MKPGDLIYWHENAWLMSKPDVKHAVVMYEHKDSKPLRPIWHVLVLETGQPGIVHDTPNVKVKVSSDV